MVELERFPLVVVRIGAEPTDEDFEGYLRRFETLMVDDVLYSMVMTRCRARR